ncbi:MAG: ABC transporter permease [Verrucomicrobium sp.]|nr:ABC transporter permease [Verrucomicrobium sp.]
MNSFTPAVLALTRREVVRFLRQRNRVVGALATPLVFWFLIGSGVGRSFSGAGGSASYLQYFFPGTLLLIILFTAIFSTISIIEDRREGFLQGVLVSPIPRSAFVLAKLLGGTLLSLLQCVLLYGLAAAMGLPATPGGFLLFLAAVVLLGLGLTALGYLIAWPLDSTQGFHALMNLVLMPLWFLSGALFPPGGAAGWLRALMAVNPLSYGLELLRASLNPHAPAAVSLPAALAVTALFALALGWACAAMTEKRGARHP